MEVPAELVKARNIALATYRKSGKAVETPVWLVVDGSQVYVRTDPTSGKAKRIRNNPTVRLAECTFRGEVTGNWFDGQARFIEGADAQRVLGMFKKKYGMLLRVFGLSRKLRGRESYAVIAITLSSQSEPAAAA